MSGPRLDRLRFRDRNGETEGIPPTEVSPGRPSGSFVESTRTDDVGGLGLTGVYSPLHCITGSSQDKGPSSVPVP